VRGAFLGAFALVEGPRGILLVGNRRTIDGRRVLVWDLPGGGVEDGETLEEALVREVREETGLLVAPRRLLFVAEGERRRDGRRVAVWRSVFFAVDGDASGIDTSADPEIEDHRWARPEDLPVLLTAPYHGGFLAWLASGRTTRHTFDVWAD